MINGRLWRVFGNVLLVPKLLLQTSDAAFCVCVCFSPGDSSVKVKLHLISSNFYLMTLPDETLC